MKYKFIHTNIAFKDRRRDLRRNATIQEKLLWWNIRGSRIGYKFRRQHSIGPYIVDFYCAEKRLVIEIDGEQHLDLEAQKYDQERTKYLNDLNHRVLRFSNGEINTNMKNVINRISEILRTIPSRRLDTLPKLGREDGLP